MHCTIHQSCGPYACAATVVSESCVWPLKEIVGMLSLHFTPFQAVTGIGARERPDSAQLILAVGDKEFHLPWPGAMEAMLADATFQWIVRQWRAAQGAG